MSNLTHIEEDTVESQVEKLDEAIQHLQVRVAELEQQVMPSTPQEV
jgi:vacuolar-type H+-ATPase subunit D/Vma8